MKSIVKKLLPLTLATAFLGTGIATAQAEWRPSSGGNIPKRAKIGGKEANGEPLFICRASFNGGVHPGKLRPAFGGCNIPWGGGEHAVRNYSVLLKNEGQYKWVSRQGGKVPRNAVRGGREANGEPLYVCRANFNGGVHPGKIRVAFNGCNVPWGGREHRVGSYQVLVNK